MNQQVDERVLSRDDLRALIGLASKLPSTIGAGCRFAATGVDFSIAVRFKPTRSIAC